MSAQDNIDEAKAEAEGAPLGALIALIILGSCANTPKNVNQDRKPEKAPVKIEQHQNIATNQFYRVKQANPDLHQIINLIYKKFNAGCSATIGFKLYQN